MKFSGSKKSIIILIVCLFLLLFSFLLIYFRDVISNGIKYGRWFTMDKYEELLEDCEWQRNENEIRVTCNAILKTLNSEEDDILCYGFDLITEKGLVAKKVCEPAEKTTLKNSFEDLNKLIPVKIFFNYEQSKLVFFKLSMVDFVSMTNKEYFSLFETYNVLLSLPNVTTENDLNYSQYTRHFIDKSTTSMYGIPNISYITFDAELINFNENGEYIEFLFKTTLIGEEVSIRVLNKSMLFSLMNSPQYKPNYLDKSNLSNLEIGKQYVLIYIFPLDSYSELFKKVSDKCDGQDLALKILCQNISEQMISKEESIITTEYLEDLISSSSNKQIEINNGVLLELVLVEER